MNNNLLEIINRIISEKGKDILSEPKRVTAMFADLARDVPKPQKNAFIKCLEHGFVQTLKDVSENERAACKQSLAQKLHEEEGLDIGLCDDALDLLEAALFGEVKKAKKKKYCKSCNQELQPEWKTCPYCASPVASHVTSSHKKSSSLSSGSGSGGYGVGLIQQNTQKKPAKKKVNSKCDGCSYVNFISGWCNNYDKPLYEAQQNCYLTPVSVQSNYSPPATPQVRKPKPQAQPPAPKKQLKRNGFTSFWLWVSMIGSVIYVIPFVLEFFEIISRYDLQTIWPPTDFILWSYRIYAILSLFGYYNLLKWKKSGYNLIVFASAALFAVGYFYSDVNGYNNNFFMAAAVLGIPVLILRGVLAIRNSYNASSTWDQMDFDYRYKNNIEHPKNY